MDWEWKCHLIFCLTLVLANPACEQVGCGKWEPAMIQNPSYKGRWKPALIENPDYMVSCLLLKITRDL